MPLHASNIQSHVDGISTNQIIKEKEILPGCFLFLIDYDKVDPWSTWIWTAWVHLQMDFFFPNKCTLQYYMIYSWLNLHMWNHREGEPVVKLSQTFHCAPCPELWLCSTTHCIVVDEVKMLLLHVFLTSSIFPTD